MLGKDEVIDEIVARCKEVMQDKGDAYSMQIDGLGKVDDIMLSGLDVVLNRIISKAVRLNNQLKGREVSFQGYDKKPDDDFIDLINHCFIGLMLRQGLWYAGWDPGEPDEPLPGRRIWSYLPESAEILEKREKNEPR